MGRQCIQPTRDGLIETKKRGRMTKTGKVLMMEGSNGVKRGKPGSDGTDMNLSEERVPSAGNKTGPSEPAKESMAALSLNMQAHTHTLQSIIPTVTVFPVSCPYNSFVVFPPSFLFVPKKQILFVFIFRDIPRNQDFACLFYHYQLFSDCISLILSPTMVCEAFWTFVLFL